MADITDIKRIVFTEKALKMQEEKVITYITSSRVTKNSLKQILKDYFGIKVEKINSLKLYSKPANFKGRKGGSTSEFKKFLVKVPADSNLETMMV
jgi:large subunit ribosomal protein L23